MYSKSLEQKIENLNNKIKKEIQERKEVEKSKEFEVAKPLSFTRKVTVKPLPTEASELSSYEEQTSSDKLTPPPIKPSKKLVSFKKLEKEKELKPLKITQPPLKIIKKASTKGQEKEVTKPTEAKKPKEKMPMEIFSPHEEIKKDLDKPLVIDFTKELQQIIIQKGSSLSLELCQNLITELQKSLGRPLTLEDIETAAEFFVKQEQLT
jgi:hypothetical protein